MKQILFPECRPVCSQDLQLMDVAESLHKERLAGGHIDHSSKEKSSDDLTSSHESSLKLKVKMLQHKPLIVDVPSGA